MHVQFVQHSSVGTSRYPEACVSELFERQVEIRPNAPAVSFHRQTLTFRELNSRADAVAHVLRNTGVGPELLVGVCFERSLDAVIAVFGILKAGGAYVGLDPAFPAERLNAIICDSRLRFILTSDDYRDRLPLTDARLLNLEDALAGSFSQNLKVSGMTAAAPDNTAYVSFTSGSTGRPKGVIVSHRAIVNGMNWLPFDVRDDEVCAVNTSLSFGFSAARLFLPLMCGVPVVMVSENDARDVARFVTVLADKRVTSIAVVTPVLREILNLGTWAASRLQGLRTVTVGGSLVTEDLIDSFASMCPEATLLVGYAASEIGGAAFVNCIERAGSRRPPGRTFPNTEVLVLAEDMSECSRGTAGEVYVRASHVSRGYLHAPVATAERFVPDPRASGGRLFRTGDVGRYRRDGQLEVCGRVDDQVKVRGYRVNVLEIENVLRSHPAVAEAAVIGRLREDDTYLTAYVASKNGSRPNVTELRKFIGDQLPEFMIPATFMWLERLPRTDIGKIDKQALPAPEPIRPRPDLADTYVAPRTDLESTLSTMWADVFGFDRVGIHDSFPDLGGDSLLAVQIATRIRDFLGVEIPARLILDRTIARLSSVISSLKNAGNAPLPDSSLQHSQQ